ncbi:hypothetical protein N7468_003835 [Penicillium chermesinum]|uniref:Uncharacterized protein n=1 Tax=Penicillium chermesinum TaxID=63820 RepID=A0A9W9P7Y7_9EURO|nr:uncharacterized protein N7468_003835 [Penicillium chermesinum]KAJ5239216.1 hypothetical protein N7468_003835 [Penicillium chermesinum]
MGGNWSERLRRRVKGGEDPASAPKPAPKPAPRRKLQKKKPGHVTWAEPEITESFEVTKTPQVPESPRAELKIPEAPLEATEEPEVARRAYGHRNTWGD